MGFLYFWQISHAGLWNSTQRITRTYRWHSARLQYFLCYTALVMLQALNHRYRLHVPCYCRAVMIWWIGGTGPRTTILPETGSLKRMNGLNISVSIYDVWNFIEYIYLTHPGMLLLNVWSHLILWRLSIVAWDLWNDTPLHFRYTPSLMYSKTHTQGGRERTK